MGDCWKTLGIQRTADKGVIRRAYTALIKKYHPDIVRIPEKKRRYTIKCVAIIEAYREAMQYATGHRREEVGTPTSEFLAPQRQPRKHVSFFNWAIRLICVVLLVCPILFIGAVLLESFGIYPAMNKCEDYFFSLPLESSSRMIISLPLALVSSVVLNAVLSVFSMLPGLYLLGIIRNPRFESYTYKAAFLISVCLNYAIVYHVFPHWFFEHKINSYYVVLYHFSRLVAAFYGPLCLFALWVRDLIRYPEAARTVASTEITPFAGEPEEI